MRFYIASYVGERQWTQKVQSRLRSLGHEITVDLTALPGVPSDERNARPDDVTAIAVRDLDGIVKAEVFILLAGVPEGRAKYVELGAAIMSAVQTGKPRIYVLGKDPVHSVFFFHPTVKRMTSLDDVLNDIEESLNCLPRECIMSVEEEILALEATWSVAPLEGDVQTVSRVTADDWIGVSPTGAVMSKVDLLEMLSSRPPPFESAVYEQVQLHVYGQTAVVTSLFRGEGRDVKLDQRFMRVYANRDGRWQCVATQIVPVPEQEATS